VKVAGSLPPACGSYRPDLFDPAVARPVLQTLIQALRPYVDVWLAETVSSEAEMLLVSELLAGSAQPWWVSFTLAEGTVGAAGPQLRSGEAVGPAVAHAVRRGAQAVLFNCCQPEVIGAGVIAARQFLDAAAAGSAAGTARLGAYANAFPPQGKDAHANDGMNELRTDLGPLEYLDWVRTWLKDGADIVGGCCGVGPEHIALMRGSIR
jgi:S-methylmethionine-dependent homocysteine/selenocysteine methylase